MASRILPHSSIAKVAARGVFWSAAQNWGGRLIIFVLFLVLAHYLSPSDFGLSAAATLVLTLIGLLAEFGFGSAIVQRRVLGASDTNLPFFVSLTVACLLAGGAALAAGTIGRALKVDGLEPVLMAVCMVAPISAVSSYQEMHYRRQLGFRMLALRVLVANTSAGVTAVACARAGFGVWSLVTLTCINTLVGCLWLWCKPLWLPGRTLDLNSFVELGRFGASITLMRLIDFGSLRLLDVLIVVRYGIAGLGLYAVGSRIYLTLMQLLQSVLNDVALTVLSKISHERERMARIYLQTITIAAFLASPIFVAAAAMAPELCHALLGRNWYAVGPIARPLLLLGALQCVQFLNSSYLSARGRPHLVLVATIAKAVALILGLGLLPAGTLHGLVLIYAVMQLASTPFSFGYTARELGIPLGHIILQLLPAICANIAAYTAVIIVHPAVVGHGFGVIVSGGILCLLFTFCYGFVALLLGRQQIAAITTFIALRFQRDENA